MSKESPITLDELAGMVAAGFKEQREELQQLDGRLNTRIDGLETKLGALHSDVLSMSYDHKKMKARIENIELRVFGAVQEA
jgi:cupin superfamily acireductone dioxygenase involved in methionine salvage